MKNRLNCLRLFMKRTELGAVIVSKPENRRYFSGFTGDSGVLVITGSFAKLLTDFRYMEQAGVEAPEFEIVEHARSMMETVGKVLQESRIGKAGFEGDAFTYNEFSLLSEQAAKIQLRPIGLDQLRVVKDDGELRLLKKAVEISDHAFSHILTFLRPGISEIAVAAELENVMRKLGSQRPAFETIVASGKRGSLPHGLATEKLLEPGDFVAMDFGAVYGGYHSDITRTVCIGKASEKQRKLYDIVLEAQRLGVDTVRPGAAGKAVDAVVRGYLIKAGYGKFFGHGLGHGVGLAIHELPRLSPSSNCENLQPGMLVTVEPGIYLPDFGGVRIEDTVLITAQGAKILTQSSKQFIEIE